jgi:hypothetical protein
LATWQITQTTLQSAFATAFDGKTTEDSAIGSDFNAVVEELSSLTSQASEVGLFELPQKIDDLRAELFQAVGPDGYFMTSVLGVLYKISSDNEAMFHNLNAHVDNASSELLAVIQETNNMSSLVISHLDDSTADIQSQLKRSYNLALSATGEHSSILNVINDNVTKEIKSLATALHRDVPQQFLDEFKRSVSVDLSSASRVLMSQMQRQWESQSNLSRHVLDNTCSGFDRTLANVRNDILSRVDAQEVQLQNTISSRFSSDAVCSLSSSDNQRLRQLTEIIQPMSRQLSDIQNSLNGTSGITRINRTAGELKSLVC